MIMFWLILKINTTVPSANNYTNRKGPKHEMVEPCRKPAGGKNIFWKLLEGGKTGRSTGVLLQPDVIRDTRQICVRNRRGTTEDMIKWRKMYNQAM